MSVEFAASGEFCFDSRLRADRLALSVLQWKLFRSGIVARSPLSAQGLVRTAPAARPPGSADAREPGIDLRAAVVSAVAQGRRTPALDGLRAAASRRAAARSSLRSADPRDKPKIQLNLLAAEADRAGLRNIVKFVRRFFATAPASDWSPQELKPGPQVQGDAAIDAHLRANVRTAMHPTSTCAMGTDSLAVVDGQLRVHGLSGLRIADASIMPAIVGGNTNAPTIMIAEKAVDLIRGL